MLLFRKIRTEKSHFEKNSRLLSRVTVAPTKMKFEQNMHMDIIKLFYLAEFWNLFSKYSPRILEKHKKNHQNTKKFKKNLKNQKFKIPPNRKVLLCQYTCCGQSLAGTWRKKSEVFFRIFYNIHFSSELYIESCWRIDRFQRIVIR